MRRMAGKKRAAGGRVVVARSATTGGWVVSSAGGRRSRTFATKSAATKAARALAGGDDIRLLEAPVTRTSPIKAFSQATGSDGVRTTLRIPDELTAAAALLASDLGISKNDALVRLALAGAHMAEQARAVSETRDQRWLALLAAHDFDEDAGFPEPHEMEEAALALRRDAVS
jgi:Uncharacterized protein conserved in bacteria (DUF2188)